MVVTGRAYIDLQWKMGQKEMQKGKFAEEKNTWKHNVTSKTFAKIKAVIDKISALKPSLQWREDFLEGKVPTS